MGLIDFTASMTITSLEAFVHAGGNGAHFVRALGVSSDYINDILRLDEAASDAYKRIDDNEAQKLQVMPVNDELDYYIKSYNSWHDGGCRQAVVKCIKAGSRLSEIFGEALEAEVENYRLIKQGMAAAIERNFVVKLMYRFDNLVKGLPVKGMSINKLLTDKSDIGGIKIVAQNVIKEQEYLFYHMLTLIGMDVLLLQYRADINISPRLCELSQTFCLGEYRDIDIPGYIINISKKSTIEENNSTTVKVIIPQRPGRTNQKTDVSKQRNTHIREANPFVSSTREEKSFEQLALLASSVVMITIHDENGKTVGSGSGIMIGKRGYILTNHHVACGGRFYTIKIEDDNNSYNTDAIIKYNSVLDLAIIKIDRELNPLPIYKGAVKPVRGQKVVAIGSPLGLFNSVSDGIISGFRNINDVEMIQFTAPISHGSSGGALLNMYGEVIGISTAGIDDGQNLNLAVGYEFINTFIQGFC